MVVDGLEGKEAKVFRGRVRIMMDLSLQVLHRSRCVVKYPVSTAFCGRVKGTKTIH